MVDFFSQLLSFLDLSRQQREYLSWILIAMLMSVMIWLGMIFMGQRSK